MRKQGGKLVIDNRTVMIQGTGSDVGKSILATALCRIFARKNLKVAPFKSWNMSLNSYVTADGGEIGIAQAIQAQAAGISPTVEMQPILVKPRGKGLSQIIIRGKAIGERGHHKDKQYINWALLKIRESLEKLRSEYDLVVIEGAGSPVELNVKEQDLANMKVAALFKTPVILVTDVDRGGALAALVGTLRLLEAEERDLVQGLIINRFRGDLDLLKPGVSFLEEYTGKPVLGVIPYIKDIRLPEEDAASLRINNGNSRGQDLIKIGVIHLPHLANFTDFSALTLAADVSLKYIKSAGELAELDLIIIPGSKSTTTDLSHLKANGLADGILQAVGRGVPVIGICGGYQMMGERLYDPDHTEGDYNQIDGLGLLAIETTFFKEKTTQQVRARIKGEGLFFDGLKGEEIEGYEIHKGESSYLPNSAGQFNQNKIPFIIRQRSRQRVRVEDGLISADNLHFGTYLHGLFNNDQFRNNLLNKLREQKGLPPLPDRSSYYRGLDADYDQLAAIVAQHLRIDLIEQLLAQGVISDGC